MECLIRRMNELLSAPEDAVELIRPVKQEMDVHMELDEGMAGMQVT